MKRRTFIAGLGSAAAWPVVARAQQGMRRIGVLMSGDENDPGRFRVSGPLSSRVAGEMSAAGESRRCGNRVADGF